MRSLILPVVFLASSVASAQLGSVLREQRLTGLPSFGDGSAFGGGMASPGDLDGDGVLDLVVGAPFASGTSGVWVLFLQADGTVRATTQIAEGVGGFVGTAGLFFGENVVAIGDLDGDGRSELAVSGRGERTGRNGRVHILFLNADGTVRAQNRISSASPVFGGNMGTVEEVFGLASFTDLDGDGLAELLWGDPEGDSITTDSGALWIVSLHADGSARAAQRIANGVGGFPSLLDPSDDFGMSSARAGDVNGDGHEDLFVLDNHAGVAPSGRLWTLFLDAAGQVIGQNVFSAGDLAMDWENPSGFVNHGSLTGVRALEDLDGDGVRELALASTYRSGATAITFVARTGALRKRLLLANGEGGLVLDANRPRNFPRTLLGDLDGDGTLELAVDERGTVALLSLDASAVRNGSGLNPEILAQSGEPRIGGLWRLDLDCGGHAPGLAYYLFSSRPLAGAPTGAGELLVDPAGLMLLLGRDHAGNVARQFVGLPVDLSLVNRVVHVQGACSGAPGLALSNALDVQVGR